MPKLQLHCKISLQSNLILSPAEYIGRGFLVLQAAYYEKLLGKMYILNPFEYTQLTKICTYIDTGFSQC